MVRNITLSAEGGLIQKARERARQEKKTLNDLFREWLARYVRSYAKGRHYSRLVEQLQYVNPGRKFSRDDMNER